MKTGARTMMAAAALGVWCAAGVWAAGDLDPTNAPGPTMYTLEELYQRLQATEQQVLENQRRLADLQQRMGADGMADVVDGTVLIPGGDFTMGDSFGEGASRERPRHTVTVSAYYMDQYEVTKAQWDEVYEWAATNGYTFDNAGSGRAEGHPVYNVNWYDCVKWANARSEMEGLAPCYYTSPLPVKVYRNGQRDLTNACVQWEAGGYRLPTEAEWEKAARGGATGRRFPWSDVSTIQHTRANYYANPDVFLYDTSPTTGAHPHYADATDPGTSPVGSFAPNGRGLYDMAGNTSEWCWDRHESGYYSISPGVNPRGPDSPGASRVFRGGGWSRNAHACRVASRDALAPTFANNFVGFRLVRSAP